ncbi:hypothetical protein GCM10019016_119350 [Streptomyces prasinosporus]|uniref:Uncharacterized protein n=1 Tax=Streptomyces prasinosporus TaxID=68256 RepID=A0ABP6UDW5_9ACTN
MLTCGPPRLLGAVRGKRVWRHRGRTAGSREEGLGTGKALFREDGSNAEVARSGHTTRV